jgi:hypothetical protein
MAVEDADGAPVGAQVLPDVFDRVQFRAAGWQGQQGKIVADDEGGRSMPARAVEDEHGMGGGGEKPSGGWFSRRTANRQPAIPKRRQILADRALKRHDPEGPGNPTLPILPSPAYPPSVSGSGPASTQAARCAICAGTRSAACRNKVPRPDQRGFRWTHRRAVAKSAQARWQGALCWCCGPVQAAPDRRKGAVALARGGGRARPDLSARGPAAVRAGRCPSTGRSGGSGVGFGASGRRRGSPRHDGG